MRLWTTKRLKLLCLLCALVVPAWASASVQITEIMYDAPGSDSGHEWVEVTNTGSTTEDIAGYKFFEGGVHHALAIVAGTTTLVAGGSAVIANDPSAFLIGFPAYAGALFKSSFSLNNTGETVSLDTKSLVAEDTAAYSSAAGADGDGNSLHKVAAGFVAGAPDPGVYSVVPPAPIVKAVPAASSAPKTAATSKTKTASSTAASSSVLSAAAIPPLPTSSQNQPIPWWSYALGFCALAMLGTAGVLYARPGGVTVPNSRAETTALAGEFEIE